MARVPLTIPARVPLAAWAAAVAAVVLAGCSAGTPGPTSSTASPSPVAVRQSTEPTSSIPVTRFEGTVTVSSGHTLPVWCLGTGSPTIVLEAGGTRANMRDWGTDFPRELAAHTTVCTYSHYGADGNTPGGETLTFAGILSDADGVLAAMKAQAGINGPYVFVGWSFGGEVALGEVTEDLTRAAGFVILDTDLPRDFRVACAAAGRTPADCQAEFDGDREAKQLEVAIVAGIKPIPRIPVALVSAMQPGPDCAPAPGASEVTYSMGGTPISAPDCVTLLQRIADEDLADWRTVAPQIVQTRVDADHDGLIQIAGPQIVDLIVAMLGLAP